MAIESYSAVISSTLSYVIFKLTLLNLKVTSRGMAGTSESVFFPRDVFQLMDLFSFKSAEPITIISCELTLA